VSRDSWPPGEGEGAHTPADARHRHHQTTGYHTSGIAHRSTRRRHIGLYASGWRDGFSAGAVDALRLAAREIDDPHLWCVLDRLADRYRSDYGLCGSDG
jgi:hypothetical protein